MDDTRDTIRLEIEVAGESLYGRAISEGGLTRDFTGWLGLVAALDTLITKVAKADEAPANAAGDIHDRPPSSQ